MVIAKNTNKGYKSGTTYSIFVHFDPTQPGRPKPRPYFSSLATTKPGSESAKPVDQQTQAAATKRIRIDYFVSESEHNQALIGRSIELRYVPGIDQAITSRAAYERALQSDVARDFWWPLGAFFLLGLALMLIARHMGRSRTKLKPSQTPSTSPEPHRLAQVDYNAIALWWRRQRNVAYELPSSKKTEINGLVRDKKLVVMITNVLPFAKKIQSDFQKDQLPCTLYKVHGDGWLFTDFMIFISKTIDPQLAWYCLQKCRPYQPKWIYFHDPFNWLLQEQVIWIGHLGHPPPGALGYQALAELPNYEAFKQKMQWHCQDYKKRERQQYSSQYDYFTDLIKNRDYVAIEAARDQVTSKDLDWLLDYFERHHNHTDRLLTLQLLQDHLKASIPRHYRLCQTVLSFTQNNSSEEYWHALAIAICVLEDNYGLFDKLISDFSFAQSRATHWSQQKAIQTDHY